MRGCPTHCELAFRRTMGRPEGRRDDPGTPKRRTGAGREGRGLGGKGGGRALRPSDGSGPHLGKGTDRLSLLLSSP